MNTKSCVVWIFIMEKNSYFQSKKKKLS